jgi:SAM-dependent methyltransferase
LAEDVRALRPGGDPLREQGLSNVRFEAVNVNEWEERSAYDLVYCRFLLEHLNRPADLLRRMWAAVRPGGAVVVEDADFDGLFCHPPDEGFTFWARAYARVLERHGGDPVVASDPDTMIGSPRVFQLWSVRPVSS